MMMKRVAPIISDSQAKLDAKYLRSLDSTQPPRRNTSEINYLSSSRSVVSTMSGRLEPAPLPPAVLRECPSFKELTRHYQQRGGTAPSWLSALNEKVKRNPKPVRRRSVEELKKNQENSTDHSTPIMPLSRSMPSSGFTLQSPQTDNLIQLVQENCDAEEKTLSSVTAILAKIQERNEGMRNQQESVCGTIVDISNSASCLLEEIKKLSSEIDRLP